MALDLVQRYKAPDLAVEVDTGARAIIAGTNVSFVIDPVTGAITISSAGGGGGGSGEALVADNISAPPIMLTNEAEDDFLYGD